MKSEKSVCSSALARIKQLIHKGDQLALLSKDILSCFESPVTLGRTMKEIRACVDEINQSFHEFNAYYNVLKTE